MTAAYINPRTGETFPIHQPRWCGPERAPLLITPLPGMTRNQIDRNVRSLWRYRAALPLRVESPITLGEGCTPLVPRRLYDAPVLLKCEWFMPTGSFKDRGASVLLSVLRSQGIRSLLEESSGNGGAAVSAYAAAGGLRATIVTPAQTSSSKAIQIQAHGASVNLVSGMRQATSDATEAAADESSDTFYATWNPFFIQGTKTLAYELWEDLDFDVPDNIIVPCGAGSNVLGCYIGFSELHRAGEIERIPRIFAAQPANCAPVVSQFLKADAPEARPTIAEGTAIARPMRILEIVDALRESRGGAIMLTEDEIAGGTLDLARIGAYVEPTSGQVAAAFAKLLASGAITPEQRTVLILTGTGLKTSAKIAELVASARSLPSLSEQSST